MTAQPRRWRRSARYDVDHKRDQFVLCSEDGRTTMTVTFIGERSTDQFERTCRSLDIRGPVQVDEAAGTRAFVIIDAEPRVFPPRNESPSPFRS